MSDVGYESDQLLRVTVAVVVLWELLQVLHRTIVEAHVLAVVLTIRPEKVSGTVQRKVYSDDIAPPAIAAWSEVQAA